MTSLKHSANTILTKLNLEKNWTWFQRYQEKERKKEPITASQLVCLEGLFGRPRSDNAQGYRKGTTLGGACPSDHVLFTKNPSPCLSLESPGAGVEIVCTEQCGPRGPRCLLCAGAPQGLRHCWPSNRNTFHQSTQAQPTSAVWKPTPKTCLQYWHSPIWETRAPLQVKQISYSQAFFADPCSGPLLMPGPCPQGLSCFFPSLLASSILQGSVQVVPGVPPGLPPDPWLLWSPQQWLSPGTSRIQPRQGCNFSRLSPVSPDGARAAQVILTPVPCMLRAVQKH